MIPLALAMFATNTLDVPPAPAPSAVVRNAPAAVAPTAESAGRPLSELVGAPAPANLTPVTVIGPDGFVLTVDADRAPGYFRPPAADQADRLFAELCAIRPWASTACPGYRW